MANKKEYVIFGGIDFLDKQPVFWNNETGWGFLCTADKYTEEQKKLIERLPRYSEHSTSVWVEL